VSSNYIRKAYPLARPVPYHRAKILLPPATPGLTRRLLYQGMAAGELKLSYREFTNDLARPAFEESLSVPLSAEFPQKVAAKGATLTIYKIDGLGMDYQVDDPGSFAAPL
ncbi:MAG TPA: hypothetical protein VL100_06640, partial [Croceibacterium sp.]|nr:hypothetical protein [Croceibacterium sp.]